MTWDPDRDGPGVIRSVDPLARAIERLSDSEKAALTLALVRLNAARPLDYEKPS